MPLRYKNCLLSTQNWASLRDISSHELFLRHLYRLNLHYSCWLTLNSARWIVFDFVCHQLAPLLEWFCAYTCSLRKPFDCGVALRWTAPHRLQLRLGLLLCGLSMGLQASSIAAPWDPPQLHVVICSSWCPWASEGQTVSPWASTGL